MRSKQTTINAHKKGGELSRMYNELVAQFFWPESLLLLHEKTCGHRMLFSKRLSVSKRITRGFFPCISFFFLVLLCCIELGCRHRKTHYRFISEIIINFFFSNACQRQECNLNEFHSIAASKHMLTRNNYRRNGWGRKKLTFVVIVGAMMMFYFLM